jgi:hypothetical protein
MIPFKYKGYDIKIEGVITPSTDRVKFTFSNGIDDNSYFLKLNTSEDKKWHNVVNKIKNSVNARLLYLKQRQ